MWYPTTYWSALTRPEKINVIQIVLLVIVILFLIPVDIWHISNSSHQQQQIITTIATSSQETDVCSTPSDDTNYAFRIWLNNGTDEQQYQSVHIEAYSPAIGSVGFPIGGGRNQSDDSPLVAHFVMYLKLPIEPQCINSSSLKFYATRKRRQLNLPGFGPFEICRMIDNLKQCVSTKNNAKCLEFFNDEPFSIDEMYSIIYSFQNILKCPF